ncbi:cobalt import ATP-binding protein CbiO 2 [Firmicutes bacterium CAG:449]|nr:cobalt import ATP-binding protein CbiO 2 [Firmicutes bacterium CAG:449]
MSKFNRGERIFMSIRFENVFFTYQKNTPFEFSALKNINLTINEGDFVSIIGHTGSGKSTLIQQINALLKPTEGKVYVGEYIISNEKKIKNLKQLKKYAGLVFQFPEYQLFEETVLKDVCFGPKNFNEDEKSCRNKAIKALEMVGIDSSLYNKSPFDLSGGQKRRVAIAGIIALQPKILILDEPTAGLDPRGEKDIMELFKKIHENGTTIIMVSHNMNNVLKYSNRAIVMNEGEIVLNDTPTNLFKRDDLFIKYNIQEPNVICFAKNLIKGGLNINLDLIKDEKSLVSEIKRAYYE